MNRNQRIALAEKDLKVKDLGFRLNLHAGYISNILAGHYKAPKAREGIARILGKSESHLWSEDRKDP